MRNASCLKYFLHSSTIQTLTVSTMIDPTINNKVIQAAVAAARRSRRVDFSELWGKLKEIDMEVIFDALDSFEYRYGALPVLGQPATTYSAQSTPLPAIGIDGSQVYPDWEQPVLWGYIQALAYRKLSEPAFLSDFVDIGTAGKGDERDVNPINWRGGAESINFWRTLLEMRLAVNIASITTDQVILMDYPLLPWIGYDAPDPESQIREYLGLVDKLKGRLVAGIISGPKSKLLVSLIGLAEKIQDREPALANISDDVLMAYGLPAGDRSAVFKYAGPRNEICKRLGAEICFFFIHIKDRDVVRVEIPDWLVSAPEAIDRIHASILADSLTLGYPYVLAAAHQNVAIPFDVANALQRLAIETYIREGGYYYLSAKKRAKGIK